MTETTAPMSLAQDHASGGIKNAQPALTGYLGLGVFLGCFAVARNGEIFQGPDGFVTVCCLAFLAMALCDVVLFRVYRQPDVGGLSLDHAMAPGCLLLLWQKTVGLLISIAILLAVYRSFPLYQDIWYQTTFSVAWGWAPILLPPLLVYLVVFHLISAERDDSLSQFGRFCRSLGRQGDRAMVRDYLLSLAIKGFFIPLMLGFGLTDWGRLTTTPLVITDFRSFFEFVFQMFLLTDVVFGVIGYVCGFRILSAHIRWPERRAGGWLFCLMCYVPFWQIFNQNYLTYSDGIVWGNVFALNGLAYTIWGSAILVLMGIYTLSTVSFGFRFSNLTYRGLVRSGPYRLARHPAYLSKNLSYWMVEIPVLGSSFGSAFANTLALILINLIYYMRARYEERCCLEHEDYRIYYDSPHVESWLSSHWAKWVSPGDRRSS